LDSIIFQ